MKLNKSLVGIGFRRCNADYSIYYIQKDTTKIIILVYIDDLVLLSNNLFYLEEIKKTLGETFAMKDMGEISSYLGIGIKRDRKNRSISLNQLKYIEDILKKYGMEDVALISTPMDVNLKLTKEMCPKTQEEVEEMKRIPYQSVIGSLMYCMLRTRPDIAFPVGALSQYNTNYGKPHWIAVKRILWYLQATKHLQLTYISPTGLLGYCDADYGGDTDDRRSFSGFAFMFAGGAVSWSSKKQRTVALSSTEAEYMAVTQAAKEATWFRRLLKEIKHFVDDTPTTIFEDNQGCIALAKNPAYHAKTKHIDIQHHFIREKVEDKEIDLVYCKTEDMIADMLTKPVTRDKLQKFCNGLGLRL